MIEGKGSSRPYRIVRLIFGKYADYVWSLRYLFIFCLIIFTVSITFGFNLGNGVADNSMEILRDTMENLIEQIPESNISSPLTFFVFLLFIFINNLVTNFIIVVSGIFFGVPSLYLIVFNGFLIGGVTYSASRVVGLPAVLLSLIPHGIFEIPATILSSATGLNLGYQLLNRIRGRGSITSESRSALRLLIFRITPILFIAALIEAALITSFLSS